LYSGGESQGTTWTAREKRGHPARAVGWNDWAFWPSIGRPVPYVLTKTSIISTWNPPSICAARWPGGGGMLRDRDRPFIPATHGVILSGCLDRAPAWACCPMTSTFRSSLGLASVARRSTTRRRGRSRTIGRTQCRSPTPSSMCSRHGSAISSTNCSGRANDLRRRSL
jgi:hypothetical protein